MSNHTFALDARVLMCRNCGAPLSAPALGGDILCEYCDTNNRVAARPELRLRSAAPPRAQLPNAVAEQQRVASLHTQANAYDAKNNPYAFFRAPPGLETIQLKLAGKDYRDQALTQEVQAAFTQAVSVVDSNPGDPLAQRRCFWLARVLSQLWSAQDQFLRQRAVLETASEVLTDEGHRYILRCALASAARATGDLDDADDWLAQCDPSPMLLDLDSSYRLNVSAVALVRGQWGRALELIGAVEGQIPFDPASRLLARVARTAAFEGAGNQTAAEEELKATAGQHGRGDVKSVLDVNDSVAKARLTWTRLEASHSIPKGPRRIRSPKGCRIVLLLLTLGIVAAVVAFSPIACIGCGSLIGWHPAAMSRLEGCPAAIEALGAPVRASYVGFSCGNFETTNGSGHASWRMPVAGSRASGVYEFQATASGGRWTVNSGSVTVDGRTIDLGNCYVGTSIPGMPGVHMTPGMPGVPGYPGSGVPIVGRPCATMAACCQVTQGTPAGAAVCRNLQTYRNMPPASGGMACQSAMQALRQVLQATGSVPPQCM